MPAKKRLNYAQVGAMEHAENLEAHTSAMRKSVLSGNTLGEGVRNEFIRYTVALVTALGWRDELVRSLTPPHEAIHQTVVTPPQGIKTPEPAKTGGLLNR